MVARTDSQFELLRSEMREGFADLRTEMRGGFAEVREEMRALGSRIDDTRRDMFHGVIAIFGSMVAVFAVLVAHTL